MNTMCVVARRGAYPRFVVCTSHEFKHSYEFSSPLQVADALVQLYDIDEHMQHRNQIRILQGISQKRLPRQGGLVLSNRLDYTTPSLLIAHCPKSCLVSPSGLGRMSYNRPMSLYTLDLYSKAYSRGRRYQSVWRVLHMH
jgi:hypothetical protein